MLTETITKENRIFMEQSLKVEAIIQIPADQVLISRIEFERLQSLELTGTYWTMQELEEKTNKKRDWLKDNLLYNPRFKKILDVKEGGFVYYPEKRGQTWSFQASKMARFLDDNFAEIFSSH